MTELIGYVAAFLFAFCAFPQAITCYKQGNATGINLGFLLMWLGGEVLMQAYVLLKHGFDIPLSMNYCLNIILICFILRYKFFPRD